MSFIIKQLKLSSVDRDELNYLLTNLKNNIDEVNDKVNPMIDKIRGSEINLHNVYITNSRVFHTSKQRITCCLFT